MKLPQLLVRFALLGALFMVGRPPVARAGETPVAAKALDGVWRGPLQLPGGQIEVIYRLIKLTNGSYYAALDVPKQRIGNLTVTVATRADTVLLTSAEANSQYVGRLAANGQELVGTWQQPGFRVPLTLRYVPMEAPAPIAKASPAALPYQEQGLMFTNPRDQLLLGGVLTLPRGSGPFPAVVLLSDAGSPDRNSTVAGFPSLGILADYLTRHGVAVLRYDSRGVGQSTGTANPTLSQQVRDAQAALNLLRTRPEVDLTRLGLIGHGQGGNVALLTATQPLPPAFVVALAPCGLPGATLVRQQQTQTLRSLGLSPAQLAAADRRQQTMLDVIQQTPDTAQAHTIVANMLRQNSPELSSRAVQASAQELTSRRYREFLQFDPVPPLQAMQAPTLLLYGSADLTLDPDQNAAALQKAPKGTKDFTLTKLPGVNHLFQADPKQWPLLDGQPRPTFSAAAQEAILGWMKTHKLLN